MTVRQAFFKRTPQQEEEQDQDELRYGTSS